MDRHTSAADDDKISVADSVHGVPPSATDLPQLNPFTPEWFTQVIGAAASAAATAAATADVAGAARLPAPNPIPNPLVPRRLNDRKVPDFWEDRLEFWFQIFDAHLNHFRPSDPRLLLGCPGLGMVPNYSAHTGHGVILVVFAVYLPLSSLDLACLPTEHLLG